ncbi:hypothetical protein FRC09_002296 [Ceratobasidium sp. 395]|nr:hypothetical protein FRC09_002296 [Ceratobasidium sp. 395]
MPESSLPGSKSQRVCSIPELAIRVFDFCASQDRAPLLQTCTMLYRIGIPYVWGEVDDARHLLLLVDGAFEKMMWGVEKGTPRDVSLVDAFRRSNPFTRFDIYAPHVKSLNVYGRKRKLFKVTGWKALISRARSQALLPNLHTLVMQTSCDRHGPDQPMWVGAFASPSLVNLLITPSEPGEAPTISYEAASVLMKNILPHVSQLQTIGLFPDYQVGRYGDEGESNFLAMLSEDHFYMYLAGATSLRHLSGSLAWTGNESLLILGKLPYLETITMSLADEAGMDLDFQLPEDSFPSLRGLFFHKMDPIFASLTLHLTPLLRGLTSLHLHIIMGLVDETEFEHDLWLAEMFFPCLADAPHVENLKIYVEGDAKDGVIEPFEIDEPVLDIMSHLPLQYLQLRGLVLDSEALQMDLNSVWPLLTHLEIPAQPVSLAGLPKFIAISCLQHLEVQLDLRREDFPEPYDLESSLTTLAASKGGKVCSNFADVDFVVHVLLSVAPNLTHVTWPTPGGGASKNEVRQYECAEFLNGYLLSLRETSTLRST